MGRGRGATLTCLLYGFAALHFGGHGSRAVVRCSKRCAAAAACGRAVLLLVWHCRRPESPSLLHASFTPLPPAPLAPPAARRSIPAEALQTDYEWVREYDQQVGA